MFDSALSAKFGQAGFNVLAFFLIWLGLWLPIAIPLAIRLKWRPPQPVTPAQKLPLLAPLYLLAPLVIWGMAHLDGGSLADYGLALGSASEPAWPALLRSLVTGLMVGAIGLVIMFGLEAKLGGLTWQCPRSPDAVLPDAMLPEALPGTLPKAQPGGLVLVMTTLASTLLLGLWVGFTEELIFRGFLLNQIQPGSTWTSAWTLEAWLAGAIVSLIFAVLHLVWEWQEALPQLPGLWLMGMVLVVARWVDQGSLGLAWGLHAGWIWAIASLETLQVIHYTGRLSDRWTGRDGKPLAGFFGLLALLITGLGLLVDK